MNKKERIIKEYWKDTKQEIFMGIYHLPITLLCIISSVILPGVFIWSAIHDIELVGTDVLGFMTLSSLGALGVLSVWIIGLDWLKKGWDLKRKKRVSKK